jgi:uncharacterized membrane protein
MMDDDVESGPAQRYVHDHPAIQNVNVLHEEQRTVGDRVADGVATVVGSWTFIITQSLILGLWIVANVALAANWLVSGKPWDPYPFILLNLVLSFQAAYTGPIVMMSQNRQAAKDRIAAETDYEVNRTSERELEVVLAHLAHQDELILRALNRLERTLSGHVEELRALTAGG